MNREEQLNMLRKLGEETSILRKSVVERLGPDILDLAAVISGVIGSGGKILMAGNGGSAADASHFAAEMIVRLTSDRNRQSLPAMALSVDPSVMTAAANDFGFENVFARQVEGLGHKGDMLVVISTSGNSANLIKAVQTSREKGMISVGLLGGTGGKLAPMVDRAIVVPHPSTQRIQEEHTFIIHLLVELVESGLRKRPLLDDLSAPKAARRSFVFLLCRFSVRFHFFHRPGTERSRHITDSLYRSRLRRKVQSLHGRTAMVLHFCRPVHPVDASSIAARRNAG